MAPLDPAGQLARRGLQPSHGRGGTRPPRPRTLAAVSEQAAEALGVVMRRMGLEDPASSQLPPLITADGSIVEVRVDERPPLVDVAGYVANHA